MEASYDEDLSKNLFLQVLRREYGALFERAVSEGLVVCVPRCGSFAKSALVEDDFLAHILEPVEETREHRFRTLAGKEVKVSNRVLTIEYDIAKPCSAHLLFEETFYTDERSKYSLWCIERPLEQSITASRADVLAVTTLREALDFLWTEIYDKDIIKNMTMAIEEFQDIHDNLSNETIKAQRDLVGELYARNLRMLLHDARLRMKTESNRNFLQTIKIATETYTLHGLRNSLPFSVSAGTSQDDAMLNKTIKNLHDLQLRDLGIRADIYDGILRGKIELSRLNGHSTVLGKIGCLKKSVNHISRGVEHLSSDDILPVLIFLVLRAGLANWCAQLIFMRQFRFSVNTTNETDEADFLITSLEAAIEHVRSGVLGSSIDRHASDVCAENSQNSSCAKRNDELLANFFQSIRKSMLPEIERIIARDKGSPITMKDPKLCHPLCACEICVKKLAGDSFEHLPTVNSRDDRGMTALHVASLHGDVRIVDFLLDHDADPNDADADGTTPLHCAASRGHQNALLLLLHAAADPERTDSRGDRPLHVAADHGHEGCVKALVYFTEQMGIGFSKSPVNSNGETPLHCAAKWGYEAIVEILMEHGANPGVADRRGQTPRAIAHNSRIVKLLDALPFVSVTSRVITSGDSGISTRRTNSARGKIVDVTNVSIVDESGLTVKSRKIDRLLAAIAENDLRLACYYLGLEGPNKTALNEISFLCHPLCNCENCCAASADTTCREDEKFTSLLGVNSSNERRETALHVACEHGRDEFVRILLDAGAFVNSTTVHGRTPLHLACQNGWINVVKLLLNCGNCDVNSRDVSGDSSLHIVARNGNSRIVQLLVRHGADTKQRNSRGSSALEEAKKITTNDIFARCSRTRVS